MPDHDRFRSAGLALAERVVEQVDANARLPQLQRRRSRAKFSVALAVAVVALLAYVGSSFALRSGLPPDRFEPVGATLDPQSTELPATLYFALLDEFQRDAAGGCSGTGGHESYRFGSAFVLRDRAGSLLAAGVIPRPGAVAPPERATALGLPTTGEVCLFDLLTIRVNAATLHAASLTVGGSEWPPADVWEAGISEVGRQFVFHSRGVEP